MGMAKSKASSSTNESAGKKSAGPKAGRGGAAARGAQGGREQAGGHGKERGGREMTGTPDEHYNLTSVLYHALKGAQTCAQYMRDAEEAGDSELAEFFEDVQEAERMRADRAKELLVRRLKRTGQPNGGEEQDE